MGTYVKPEGDLFSAKLVIVGEQPGRTEIQTGRPFVGASGRELNDCLRVIGISRNDCYITNFAKDFDKHVSEYLSLKTNSYSPEGQAHRDVLMNELKQCKAKAIIAMGNYAMTAITGVYDPGINKWRGSVLETEELPDKWIVPTLHTSTVIPPKFQYLNKFLIQFDLKKAKDIALNGFKRTERNLIIDPSYLDSLQYLEKCRQAGLNGNIVYFDIEIYNEELSCISFALNANEAISIPFTGWKGHYYRREEELDLMKYITKILQDKRIVKCGQNLSFDAHFLLRRYGIRTRNIEDTMIAQHTIMSDYPKGLDFITSIWTDQIYYKDEGKKYFSGGGWEQLWRYNATDSIVCAEAFPKQLKKLETQGNRAIYEEQRKLVEPLVYMQERGIKVDVEAFQAEADKLTGEVEVLQEKLNSLAGRVLNANSPKQLKEYFYSEKKFRPYKDKGKVTTNEKAMKRIARQNCDEARIILQIRKKKKIVSTYLQRDKIDPDGRIRCSFNPVGTKFSRLSSSKNIFGTGMNMQNWPHSLLKFLQFDEGYTGYRIDLSQAENRIVAFEGNIIPMIDCFERRDDVHSLTAGLVLDKNPSEISREPGSCYLGDGTHSERDWGKKANHGLNYDLGYKSFALIFEMPEKQAFFVVNRYHQAYPGVRNNFHANVKKALKTNRTVTNLMGRNTVFMDRWGDKLFKEAYSCIPQGTVGDIMNKWGMNYIYYNQETFWPVEIMLQVHDDISFQIPNSIGFERHADLCLKIKRSLEQTLTTSYGREFVIPADVVICPKTFDKDAGNEIKSHKIPNDPKQFAKIIEDTVYAEAA